MRCARDPRGGDRDYFWGGRGHRGESVQEGLRHEVSRVYYEALEEVEFGRASWVNRCKSKFMHG